MQKGRNLYFISLQHSPVWSKQERAPIVPRGLCHIHLRSSPFLIISRHTKRWAPNNTEQIPLCAQVLNVSAATVCPPPLLLLFRYLHISERCGAHKRYPQLSFYRYSERQADFKAFICAKPLINSAHAASLGLPSLKCWVL